MSSQILYDSPQQSPIEEDISRAHSHHEPGASPTTKTERQRQKQRAEGPFVDGVDEESSSDEGEDKRGSYPPNNDEAEESRRIEENLRKWELAEKERRRAARDSTSTAASSSLVGDVAKRASLLWSGKRSRPPVQGLGQHHVVPTTDEGVALDELDNDTIAVATPDPENPFKTPNASTVSLNTPDDPAIMTEASAGTDSLTTPTKAGFRKSLPHPPKPLDLPEPRSPPPRSGTPHTNQPPEPMPPPAITADVHEEELPEKRWWTDWLCGCREREENQAARTNPFE
ncbi:hypothetical protein BC629DRAFT_1589120 [Irpex lacteus]|nr:hypothetical protein BC629DRAFT_1589120 [Irpex lacteus]